jgi:hypothetical protein
MRFRKLRIAWSVVWGVAAVLLVVLWVRDHQFYKASGGVKVGAIHATSYFRGIAFATGDLRVELVPWEIPLTVNKQVVPGAYVQAWEIVDDKPYPAIADNPPFRLAGIRWNRNSRLSMLVVPHSILVIFAVAVALAPWLRHFTYRFSLRTVLIATTLAAIVLGLAVWAARRI